MGLLFKNWWLLVLAGIVQAAISAVYLVMEAAYHPIAFYSWHRTVMLLGYLELAAGMVACAAGLLNSKNCKSWLLFLNGLAFIGLGLIHAALTRFPVSFVAVALLIMVMAGSMGLLAFTIARSLRTHGLVPMGRDALLTGIVFIGFVLTFAALAFKWIQIEPGSRTDLLWLGLYFGFSAICMFGLGLQLHARALRTRIG